MNLHVVHLYPAEMNIYGDTGNRIILQRRAEWRGIDVNVSLVGLGEEIPQGDVDIIIGGGGQDAVQSSVQPDIQAKAQVLHDLAESGTVMLMVCGLYQLFGRRFITVAKEEIKGIGIMPLETQAGEQRLIGNTNVSSEWGELVGYENHSGKTLLDDKKQALGQVIKGAGNNGQDGTEGCVYKNIFGTYLHGPILSKNPVLADELLKRALIRKYQTDIDLKPLDDNYESRAATIAKTRTR
ncbi:glutamine amidotransferase [soil metagenome]